MGKGSGYRGSCKNTHDDNVFNKHLGCTWCCAKYLIQLTSIKRLLSSPCTDGDSGAQRIYKAGKICLMAQNCVLVMIPFCQAAV